MGDLILFSDLDGTLIFSAKHRRVGDIVIERKNGVPISCITARQAELFPYLRNVIPVTTRSIEQYKRIEFAKFGFSPKYALCDNGGTLLVDGETDKEWASRSLAVYRECSDELERFRGILGRDPVRSFEIRLVDGLFLFTKSADPERTLELLGAGERCGCFAQGRKVFVIPNGLSKGGAVLRLAERLGLTRERIACAGDNLVDVSMLNIARTALFIENIPAKTVTAEEKIVRPREGFTEFVTEFASNLKETLI